ncbi:hypothetical protein OEZ86_006133 [Tetradesmus obliquus]|uniref:Uncharacterized protein n=2 Tax=Tetradesmus obliquus TaxID=3088 RepID=A0ABY8TUJ4_TETOB|nr:hypothetical protein OEZ85_006435 [Tetradesmus obliquus]WIA32970.1 hypothetical protein OEZ86_006133 [Tetradesmus obliquus]|eukprot:jgi/Sobl393_1/3951/SZX60445.1
MARVLATCSLVLLLACAAFAQTEQQAAPAPTTKGSKGVADDLRFMIPADIKTIPLAVTYEKEPTGEVIIKINAKNSGVTVPLADAADSPAVKLTGHPESFYTLAMVDIDAPGGQGAADNTNYLHWLVVNIPGHLKEGDVVDTVAEYQAPAPPAGNHRYIFTVYEQAGFVTDPAPVADRVNFDYAAYPDSQNTIGPVSAIYYIASAPAAQ